MNWVKTLCVVVLSLSSAMAFADIDIRITKSANDAQPIAIVPFDSQGAETNVSDVITADMARTGQFKTLSTARVSPKPKVGQAVNFPSWTARGADFLVVGRVSNNGDAYTIAVELYDVNSGQKMLSKGYSSKKGSLRRTAHYIADELYETLTGIRGAFNTRIAYVSVNRLGGGKGVYTLNVADSDGYAPKTVVRSSSPLLSPAWSPDGRKLAYVSFRNQSAQIYMMDLNTGTERRISGFEGINGAPSFSPDGQKLAVTLSKSGTPDIYVHNLNSGSWKQITRGRAIDTEPVWSADGQFIYFTSNRSGEVQTYKVPFTGGVPRRVTFKGQYNAGPTLSPDQKKLAVAHEDAKEYHIAVQNLEDNTLSVITKGAQDESPSFSPNSQMLIYATKENGRGVLMGVSADGRSQHRMLSSDGQIREPAWSPYNER